MVGKQKVGLLALEFGSWLGGNLSGVGIQVVGSSWAHLVNDVSLCVGWDFVLYLV